MAKPARFRDSGFFLGGVQIPWLLKARSYS
jgi:hypothetical protein